MQKLNPDVFFLVSSLVVLHAWVLPIHWYLWFKSPCVDFVGVITSFLEYNSHFKLDCLIGLIRTTMFILHRLLVSLFEASYGFVWQFGSPNF
jgi:hypothetical protein